LSELLGQQVVVDNRAGAGSNIGAEAAARSAPDGYTLLLGAPPLAINRFLYASLNYDSVSDLAPVSLALPFPEHPRGAGVIASDFGPQFHRLRQGQSRQSDLFFPGDRHHAAPVR
jgi:hypothetical protein